MGADKHLRDGARDRMRAQSLSQPRLTSPGVTIKANHVDYSKIITIEPGKRNGKPCIRGMRITVQDVLEYMAGGISHAKILEDFPELAIEDIHACLAFAADRERKLFAIPA